MSIKTKVAVTVNGHAYEVMGTYFKKREQSDTREGSPASFSVVHVISMDGNGVMDVITRDHAKLVEACLRKVEEDLAWAEMDAADKRYERNKDEEQ